MNRQDYERALWDAQRAADLLSAHDFEKADKFAQSIYADGKIKDRTLRLLRTAGNLSWHGEHKRKGSGR